MPEGAAIRSSFGVAVRARWFKIARNGQCEGQAEAAHCSECQMQLLLLGTLCRGKTFRPTLHVLPKAKAEGGMGTRTSPELDEAGGDSPAEGHLAAVGRGPPARLHREGVVHPLDVVAVAHQEGNLVLAVPGCARQERCEREHQ